MTSLMGRGGVTACVFAWIASMLCGCTQSQRVADASGTGSTERTSGYAQVNGLTMYYEIRGHGKSAVFIHPVLGHCGLVPELPANRQWICMDLQGHGRTADIDRPLTCEQHAEDIAALLKYLKVEQADFVGDSFGGAIAVMVAVRHPELVRRVVSHGGSLAAYPGTAADRPSSDSEYVKWQREEYQKVAPDPKRWTTLFDKATGGLYAWRGFTPDQLKGISVPVLIAGGDHDLLPVERFAEWSRMMPHGQLAITPDSSHFVLFSEPDKLLPILAAFLDSPNSSLPFGGATAGYYPCSTR